MANILKAICHIVEQSQHEVTTNKAYIANRANSMGGALEDYIKNAFASTLDNDNIIEKNKIFSEKFSWLGNQNNPPDLILRKGDAIEVKKTQSANAQLALNSSYPKAKIFANSPMIAQACRDCEEWVEKDLIYCIGHTTKDRLNSLWMIYGDIYAAHHYTYERIKTTISKGIDSIPDVEFSETQELGRVNNVDPLGITNLRIRGMWHIANPRKVFDYIYRSNNSSEFELICILTTNKYNSFSEVDRTRIENTNLNGFSINNAQVKNPNNPAQLIDVKVIKYIA